jgi:hypothetical protein
MTQIALNLSRTLSTQAAASPSILRSTKEILQPCAYQFINDLPMTLHHKGTTLTGQQTFCETITKDISQGRNTEEIKNESAIGCILVFPEKLITFIRSSMTLLVE